MATLVEVQMRHSGETVLMRLPSKCITVKSLRHQMRTLLIAHQLTGSRLNARGLRHTKINALDGTG